MRLLFTYLFILGFVFLGFSQTKSQRSSPSLTNGEAEDVGMSSERLSRISDMLQGSVDEGTIPGYVALIARKGNTQYFYHPEE